MKLYTFILIFIVVFVLILNEGVHCEKNGDYTIYIKRVVRDIYLQIKSKQIQNLKLKQDLINTTGIVKASKPIKLLNFPYIYCYTISVLNFKYTEILKKFLDYLDIIIRKCQRFQERNSSEDFNRCVTILEDAMKNSKTMIKSLHSAMKFISYIDIRFLFSEGVVPHAIIDEIDFIYQYIVQINCFDLNKTPNLDFKEKFQNLTKFYADALYIVNDLFENSNIIDTSEKTDLTTMKIDECSNENNYDVVFSTCSELKKFCNETIEIWYESLGFEQFLNPKIYKYIPPIDRSINQDDGIKALNILLKEPGWKSMNHIKIIYYNKLFSVDSIIKDQVCDMNFRIKKEHVLQLLRCRFTEILKNYYTLLTSILYVCKTDASGHYFKCLIELFNSFNKSEIMIRGLHTALISLNKTSIWNVNLHCKSNLCNILKCVTDYLRFLKNNKLSRDNFFDEHDKLKTEVVERLLENFQNLLNDSSHNIRNVIKYIHIGCSMNFKEFFYYKFDKINEFRKIPHTLDNLNPESAIQIYLGACNYFDDFCKIAYKSCYEDLGFNKVLDCQNKKLDDKLIPFTLNLSSLPSMIV
ncbi:uncharacterized protein LOC126899137 isoform X1 [Daktulosphaira vitifoliae]|uniref:uncharacterized protein LOC126899137 isoform X1 n=1 Tax=Daktulosphaira vitifoliae TaxID=58002 RepID=UPI0021A977BC|nr:uncharacterized protein LOC126899137 isoform X1 [Daktulosphaira vitifoliae]